MDKDSEKLVKRLDEIDALLIRNEGLKAAARHHLDNKIYTLPKFMFVTNELNYEGIKLLSERIDIVMDAFMSQFD